MAVAFPHVKRLLLTTIISLPIPHFFPLPLFPSHSPQALAPVFLVGGLLSIIGGLAVTCIFALTPAIQRDHA